MASLFRREGHDFGAPNTDGLGVFYICFALFYTVIVIVGLLFLWLHRGTTAVRIRGFWVTASSVICIHLYAVVVLLVYPLNGIFKCGAEFWMMSIVLPFGVALFQASNVRLAAYYEGQRSLIQCPMTGGRKACWPGQLRDLVKYWRQQNIAVKTYISVVAGLVAQVIVTAVLFFGSRRFHASYGLFSDHVGPGACRRGFEWVPSVFWQFLWASVFGPYVLLRIRHIQDVHYWAWQTRLAIIAALPGTPLWLAFVYSDHPGLRNVAKWFVPAGWFLPGLITMQFVSILSPILDARKNRSYERPSSQQSTRSAMSVQEKKDMYCMAALDRQIARNVDPLLQWTAEKEFTAENIVFLKAVRDFKRKWANEQQKGGQLTQEQLRERYEEAALIFFTLVNPQTARFNINIDYRTYDDLALHFEDLHYIPFEDDEAAGCNYGDNIITPWVDERAGSPPADTVRPTDVDRLYPIPVTEIEAAAFKLGSGTTINATPSVPLPVPASFTVEVFDRTYDSVKRDVFLNSWVRFIESGETTSIADSELSQFSSSTFSSYFSRLKRRI